VDALSDGRILRDDGQRLALLVNPSDSYRHGVLGDKVEALAVAIVDAKSLSVEVKASVGEDSVVEGLMPIWADIDSDGEKEIIVTASNVHDGARIVVFDGQGHRVAEGPPVGQGFRWRHQIAVAPFGPRGEIELVDVLTPHIGGIVEFYRLAGGELEVVARVEGYTSHAYGSRNLDMAAAGDFDGDGRVELLVPSQGLDHLGGIRRSAEGAEVAWTVDTGGGIVTNLAAVTAEGGQLSVGAGRSDGVLRIWPAE
jgi:hypothetical protein